VLWRNVACRPCMHVTCPIPHHPCATGVYPDDVVTAAAGLLMAAPTHAA
jgi:hypothetical protein